MTRRIRPLLGLAAAVLTACSPLLPGATDASPRASAATAGRVMYLTDAFNGAGLIAIDPLTLQDVSAKPLLPIHYTGSNNSSIATALDGGALAIMNYWYAAASVVPEGLDISVFDARTGAPGRASTRRSR